MSDEEVLRIYNHMVAIYGSRLPNPEQEPIVFSYFVKLYKYYHAENNRRTT